MKIVIAGTCEGKSIRPLRRRENRSEGLEKDVGKAPPGNLENGTVVRRALIDQAREGKETGTQRCALCFSGMVRGPLPSGGLTSHVRPHRLVKR